MPSVDNMVEGIKNDGKRSRDVLVDAHQYCKDLNYKEKEYNWHSGKKKEEKHYHWVL